MALDTGSNVLNLCSVITDPAAIQARVFDPVRVFCLGLMSFGKKTFGRQTFGQLVLA